MLLGIILVLAALGWYAFVGTAPREAVQISVALMWAGLILAAVGGLAYDLLR